MIQAPAFAATARRLAATVVLAFTTGTLFAAEHVARREDRFPHAKHARMFPVCTGCHAGIPTEAGQTRFPAPSVCAQCHNGTDQRRVDWNRPEVDSTNLHFSHRTHAAAVPPADSVTCQGCHTDRSVADSAGRRPFMAVARAAPESCIACHSHSASAHLADDNRCLACHVPIVAARALTDARVARLPRPASHERPDFPQNHTTTMAVVRERCAVCHTRESCARCHVNAASLASIAALGSDARIARAVSAKPAVYGVPSSHRSTEWRYVHGQDARAQIASCANCHARPSCTVCHIGRGAADVIGKLPAPERGGLRGVMLERARSWPPSVDRSDRVSAGGPSESPAVVSPVSSRPRTAIERGAWSADSVRVVRVHPAGFEKNHRAAATTGQLTCTGCHTQRSCADCHAGEGRRRFHVPNFATRHAADSYARERDCSSCHSTEAFCKSCHESVGVGATGRRNVAFHTAQSNWLLQHGRAARQGLQSCTGCHLQQDCMQCHAQGGWSISPHGPNFDASRMASRNRQICLACHFSDPVARP
jgi:hypothetical protein